MLSFAAAALLLPKDPTPRPFSPERLRSTLRQVCATPRLAGSAGGQAGADLAAEVFAAAGLRVERARYAIYAPRQTGQSLVLLGADGRRRELDLSEMGYEPDPVTSTAPVPPMHGLTAAGKARGRLVYAGFGRAEDFAALREAGVSTQGRIALIRYGRLYRGLKVANAEAAGCAGALLYCNRRDDGADRGEVLPSGRWRPSDGIQRGSVANTDGDPTTPGWPSLFDAERIPPDRAAGLVGIPSLPISWGNARTLLGEAMLPEMPIDLDAEVEMSVEQDPSLVEIENVLGWIDGGSRADEWVIAGAHRDAWGFGAIDNGSGTTVLLETARVLGAALEQGWRPARTLVLATWDAEEWGLVGSTEWVEQHRGELASRGLAYLNLNVVASGPSFGASCSPGMAGILRQVCAESEVKPPDSLGVPGGGSDHVPFLELAGMEVAAFGFHGGHGTYHSVYDTPWVVERFLDPDFAHHADASRLLVRLLDRLGQAETRLDGLRGWGEQTLAAARELDLEPAQRQALLTAAGKLQEAVSSGSGRLPHPQRFLRFFLPADTGGRLLLWRTEGYGASWFPDIRFATDAESRNLAVATAVAALERAALGLRYTTTPAGQ